MSDTAQRSNLSRRISNRTHKNWVEMSNVTQRMSKRMSDTAQRSNLPMGWLRLVRTLKLQVSFAKEPYKRDYILQKRHTILRSVLIVSPHTYLCWSGAHIFFPTCVHIIKVTNRSCWYFDIQRYKSCTISIYVSIPFYFSQQMYALQNWPIVIAFPVGAVPLDTVWSTGLRRI